MFKELLLACPHHGIEKWLIVHTFYNGLSYNSRMTVDAAAGGTLLNKSVGESYTLIEDMTTNHYQWSNERAFLKKTLGKYELDAISML